MAALAHLLGSRAALLGPRLAAYFGSAKEAFEASFEQVKASGILTEKGAQHYRKSCVGEDCHRKWRGLWH